MMCGIGLNLELPYGLLVIVRFKEELESSFMIFCCACLLLIRKKGIFVSFSTAIFCIPKLLNLF